ncbi:hypothetical protein LB503_000928 [Fusarium chuoi]|nr:hypothetical protein LB503_000928 [Fusarium chuoi]
MDDFATEGLRTLLFAQKFITEQEYQAWKKIWDEATTSLSDRQQRIEDAGDMIEQSFDLVGATAIEDKLQKGDKRETAINIAHSARICRPGSDLYILDITKGSLDSQLVALQEDLSAGSVHSVVVIDGQTLATVEKLPELSATFFNVMLQVNSETSRANPGHRRWCK